MSKPLFVCTVCAEDYYNSTIEVIKESLAAPSIGSFQRLVAIPLPPLPLLQDQQPEEQQILKLTNPVNPAIPICFSYHKEKHIKVDLDDNYSSIDQQNSSNNNNNNSKSHFLARAISKQQTELTKDELLQFLKLVRTATFGFFRVRNNGSWNYYFMTLSKNIQGNNSDCLKTEFIG